VILLVSRFKEAMSQGNLLKDWNPQDLIRSIAKMEHGEFGRCFGSTIFLLIKLRGHPPALLEELAFTWGASHVSLDKPADDLGFFTNTIQASRVKPSMTNIDVDPKTRQPLALPAELYQQPCFLAPIQKRKGADSFLDTVTVGRTRNHDIVLRHNSVSKFHASLHIDTSGQLSVKDTGSKNKTWLKGQAIAAQTAAVSGDTVRFGSVEAIICDAATLWNTLLNATG
jgi:hypothetical protein